MPKVSSHTTPQNNVANTTDVAGKRAPTADRAISRVAQTPPNATLAQAKPGAMALVTFPERKVTRP
jgi:hypothetical protein